MTRPVRTTIVFGLLGGLLLVPATWLFPRILSWPLVFKLALWGELAVYGLLLARWSRTSPTRLFFPLTLLLGVAVWPHTQVGFFLLALGMLSWIRSGICFRRTPVRAAVAEVIVITGACALITLLGGRTPAGWAMNIGLFFLVQSLYFFILPENHPVHEVESSPDPFERARQGAARVLDAE